VSYPSPQPPAGPGGRVASVSEPSPAHDAGIRAGESVLAVDGSRLRDVLDWLWHADGTKMELRVLAEDGVMRDVALRREWDVPWGITFDGVVFDRIRECENACAFCFVAQLPPGMRPTLYVRDDDYRLSFLSGNFITLTNLTDADVARILEQRFTPLHVSLHAVDPDVRRALMCPTVEDLALQRAVLSGTDQLRTDRGVHGMKGDVERREVLLHDALDVGI
jgi:NifB/MoaA-like Fe-S oxidoreductase